MQKFLIVLCLFLFLSLPQAEDPKEVVWDLGPNAEIFQKIRILWLQKDQHSLLALMDERVRMNFSKSEERPHQTYPAEQAAGILKEHFSEIKILAFRYCPSKMHIDRGVAVYQYQTSRGIIKNKMLYFHLQQRQRNDRVLWVLSTIDQIDGPVK